MVIQSKKFPGPGETILGSKFFMNQGGKGANQAVAASRLGGKVGFISKIGNDIFGLQSIDGLENVSSQNELREIVRRERLVELAFEGLRYFDIRRWKVSEEVIPGIIYGMTYVDQSGNSQTVSLPGFLKVFNVQRDYLWPIPQREIELNPNLTQNPNW